MSSASSSRTSIVRRSTVYDLTTLRLHPNGNRVGLSTAQNLLLRNSSRAVRDARGNWIARDAGGMNTVGKYMSAKKKPGEAEDTEDEEVIDLGDANADPDARLQDSESESGEGAQKGKRKRDERAEVSGSQPDASENAKPQKKRRKKDVRPAKRAKFMQDTLGFLDIEMPSRAASSSVIGSEIPLEMPEREGEEEVGAAVEGVSFQPPSSDLLKCIHHFASTYYHDRGQLHNGSKEYRKYRKERQMKLKKEEEEMNAEQKRDDAGNENIEAQNTPTNRTISHSHSSASLEPTEADFDEDEPEEDPLTPKPKLSRRKRPRLEKNYRQDMYKVMDGSALMVIGMLIQEHVAKLLEVNIPEGWNEPTGSEAGEDDNTEGEEDTVAEEEVEENEVDEDLEAMSEEEAEEEDVEEEEEEEEDEEEEDEEEEDEEEEDEEEEDEEDIEDDEHAMHGDESSEDDDGTPTPG